MSNELVMAVNHELDLLDAQADRINSGDASFKQVMKTHLGIEIPQNVLHDKLADFVSSKFILPGSNELKIGTMEAGYFGAVPASEMGTFVGGPENGKIVSASSLASQAGVTEGTAINETVIFHKFASEREIIFVAEKPIRHSTSWQKLAEADCVFGRKVIQIGEAKYRMTLLGGLSHELSARDDTVDSEWDRLWPLTNLLPTQLGLGGNGQWSWCKETTNNSSSGNIGLYRSLRGGSSVAGVDYDDASYVTNAYGWRPALRFTL